MIMSASWNPWHGCTKISAGCKYCYVYRQDEMYGADTSSREVRKTANFSLPVKLKRDKSYKIESGKLVYTCFTSDFFVDGADEWRAEAWAMIREREDLDFFIFTKRIDRFKIGLPDDWGNGYKNVIIGCTVENQEMADYRLAIFQELPIKHKNIICQPLIEAIDIRKYLGGVELTVVGGESDKNARPLSYEWVLSIRQQCISQNCAFEFRQCGTHFIKDGKQYTLKVKDLGSQARKANINWKGC